MAANNATKGEIACNYGVAEEPLTAVLVKINGVMVNVGISEDCYFSPDGVIIRGTDDIQKGDILFWNSSTYDLESDDVIDFEYLSYFHNLVLNSGESVTLNPVINALSVKYIGGDGSSMTVTIDGVDFTVKNVNNSLVWDADGVSYTFSNVNESHEITVNGETYTIYFDGFGSLLFSIRKGSLPTAYNFISTYGTIIGSVHCTATDSNGNIFMGGAITGFDNKPMSYLLELDENLNINEDLSVCTNKFDYYVRNAIKTSDNKILAGGEFLYYSGVNYNRIIKLNADYSVDSSFSIGSGFNSTISSIIEDSNSKYLIGGAFTTYQGVTMNRLIRLNTDGTKDTTFAIGTGFNSSVWCILNDNGKYLVGGGYTTYSGATSNYLVRLNSNGVKDTTFVYPNVFNNSVISICTLSDGKYMVGGAFNITYSGNTYNRIARLNSDGSIDTTFTLSQNNVMYNSVPTFDIYNDKIFIMGIFNKYHNREVKDYLILNMDGTIYKEIFLNNFTYFGKTLFINNKYVILSSSLGYNTTASGSMPVIGFNKTFSYEKKYSKFQFSSFTSWIMSMKAIDDKILIVNGTTVNLYNNDGSIDSSFATGVLNYTNYSSNCVDFIEYDGTHIYIGGESATYNGYTTGRIAKVDKSGNVITSFTKGGGFNGRTVSIKMQPDNKFLCAGYFTTYSGITSNRVARLNNDGTLDTTFVTGTGFNQEVTDMKYYNGKIYCCGRFTTYNGTSAIYIIRLNLDGSIDTTFNIGSLNAQCWHFGFLSTGEMILSGAFTTYNGTQVNRIVKLNSDFTINQEFLTNIGTGASSEIFNLQIINDHILLSMGYSSMFNGKQYLASKSKSYGGFNNNTTILLRPDGRVYDQFSRPIK